MAMRRKRHGVAAVAMIIGLGLVWAPMVEGQRIAKPVLHGAHWVAITGKLLAATAGARIFV